MKNFKEHKGQILAALALGLALGLAMPGAAFATDGMPEEAGEPVALNIEAAEDGTDAPAGETDGGATELSEGGSTGAGANEGEEAISQDVAENLVELNNRIKTRESFADYRKAVAMVKNASVLEGMNMKIEDLAAIDPDFKWDELSQADKEAFQGKTLLELVEAVKADPDYTDNAMIQELVAKIDEGIEDLASNLRTQLKELFPEMSGIDDMSMAQLVGAAKTYPGFEKYQKLAAAMTTLDDVSSKLADGVALTEAMVKTAYRDNEGEMMKGYNAIALAALAIDGTVMEGLMSYELPETSVPGNDKPTTPDTGTLDATDVSALDMTMLVTIAAGSLAMLGGVALVAKLYLCHKF